MNNLQIADYFEPFAGGAGIGLALLSSYTASCIHLNDADYHLYCFWRSILSENEQFLEQLRSLEVTVAEWRKQKAIYLQPSKHSILAVGLSTFFLNRCNRSGILSGSGPIGGYAQDSIWRIDARFNKPALVQLIEKFGALGEQIFIENMDAIEFLKRFLPRGNRRTRAFVYVDPPYVSAGQRLYLNQFTSAQHSALSKYLQRQTNLKWIATYDDNFPIRSLYSSCQQQKFQLSYSLQRKQQATELLLAPVNLKLPFPNDFLGKHQTLANRQEAEVNRA